MRFVVAALLLSEFFLSACSTRQNLAPKVTSAGVRSLQLGMTVDEVKSRLGEPLAVLTDSPPTTVFQYASTGSLRARTYPMLWVHVREGRVTGVYAKWYKSWGFEEETVYHLFDELPRRETPAFDALFAPR